MKTRLKLNQLTSRIKENREIILTIKYSDIESSLIVLKNINEYLDYIKGKEMMMAEVRRYKDLNGKFYIDAMSASYIDKYLIEYDNRKEEK